MKRRLRSIRHLMCQSKLFLKCDSGHGINDTMAGLRLYYFRVSCEPTPTARSAAPDLCDRRLELLLTPLLPEPGGIEADKRLERRRLMAGSSPRRTESSTGGIPAVASSPSEPGSVP